MQSLIEYNSSSLTASAKVMCHKYLVSICILFSNFKTLIEFPFRNSITHTVTSLQYMIQKFLEIFHPLSIGHKRITIFTSWEILLREFFNVRLWNYIIFIIFFYYYFFFSFIFFLSQEKILFFFLWLEFSYFILFIYFCIFLSSFSYLQFLWKITSNQFALLITLILNIAYPCGFFSWTASLSHLRTPRCWSFIVKFGSAKKFEVNVISHFTCQIPKWPQMTS